MNLRSPATLFLTLVAATSTFGAPVIFQANILDGPGEGFNDPTLGASRTAALQFAMDIWGNALTAQYVGETVVMDVEFDPLGGSATSATLGFAGALNSNFVAGNPQGANVFFAGAVRNHLSGSDQSPGGSEMAGTFNSDVDGNTVLGSTTFYYGTDGMAPAGTVDFVEVALHEIGHGIGLGGTLVPQLANGTLASQTDLNAGLGTQANYLNGGLINSYDNQVVRQSDGVALSGLSAADRYAAVIADNIAWGGAAGTAANGGTRPDLEGTYSSSFAGIPAGTWIRGSTYGHLDEDDFPTELMSPLATPGTGFLISPITQGLLTDVGWNVSGAAVPEPSGVVLFAVGGAAVYLRRRRKGTSVEETSAA